MHYFNPFNGIIESRNYTSARILRTNFLTKIKDTFYAFFSSFYDYKKRYVGLFDYATLMIPCLITEFAYWYVVNSSKNIIASISVITITVLAITLVGVRYISAGIFKFFEIEKDHSESNRVNTRLAY